MICKIGYLVFMGMILSVIAPVGGSSERERIAEASAKRWLSLVDQEKYAESWKEFASLFRDAINQGQWEQSLLAVRKPLGKLITRKTKMKTYRTSLLGAQEGEYVVIEFESSFENKKSVIETVISMMDGDGKWRVSGYYLGDARFYYNWGDDHYRKGEYDRAISNYNRALEIDPRNSAVYSNRGNAYARKGQYDQAISDYNKALEIDPRNDAVYSNRGNAYARKGQYDQAISDYSKALEIDPKKEAVYFFRGNAYWKKGEYDQAISDYSKALEINPRHALVYFNRGVAHEKKGQYDQAISDYNKTLELDPKHFRARNNLAWIFATAKDPNFRDGKKAVEFALEACELSGCKEPNHLGTLAAAYARVGDFENAVKWQEKALEDPQFAKEVETQERLKFYKDRKPWPPD